MGWTDPACEALAALVGRHAGLSFSAGGTQRAELGFRRAMARAGLADLERYRARITEDPALLADLLAELTVGETYFFREPAQFDYLRREVLPGLRRRQPAGQPSVRAWSAGCASGEEAYSLAILFEEEGFGPGAFLLGTDISHTALTRARRAHFSAWSLRGDGAAAAALPGTSGHGIRPPR